MRSGILGFGLTLLLTACSVQSTTSQATSSAKNSASSTAGPSSPAPTAAASSPAPTAAASSPTNAAAPPIPARHVAGTATTLGAGTFTGGKDVAPGLYDVTPGAGQSGNFIVQGKGSYDEILGGSLGVPKVRAEISDGDSIQISSLSRVSFTPVATPLVTTQTQVILYAGTWTVGEDLGTGRYVATPGPGQSGNFIVAGELDDEILGGSQGVPSVTVNLSKGDVITISSLSQVMMTPA